MVKASHREKILIPGMQVVHERGFGEAGIRDIVHAAGVPQGSFTNHFESEEAFALEIIDLYFSGTCTIMQNTLRNDSLPPLQRLQAFIRTRSRNGSGSCKNERPMCSARRARPSMSRRWI
jgi:TetR/AcrR family transcriptional regulator, transcriptional repressor for nem operon